MTIIMMLLFLMTGYCSKLLWFVSFFAREYMQENEAMPSESLL